jgi:hypothetical protein
MKPVLNDLAKTARLTTQLMELRVDLAETKELLRIERARSKAAERAVERLIRLVKTQHGANACCYRNNSPESLRAWAFGRTARPEIERRPKERHQRLQLVRKAPR